MPILAANMLAVEPLLWRMMFQYTNVANGVYGISDYR